MTTAQTHADLIVVGGGPVGVVMGLLCTRAGLSAIVLERGTQIYDLPRAIVADDEIQRVWAAAGLADDMAKITSPLLGAEFVDAERQRLFGVDLPAGSSGPLGYHPVVCYYQPQLEEVLRRHAVDAGVDLRLGIEVVGVGADDAGVWAETSTGPIRGRWLVAADGASSPVRKSLGIAFEDQGFDQDWLVVDMRLTGVDATTPGALGLPVAVQQICDPDRPATFVPGFGPYRRWEFQIQPDDDVASLVEPAGLWGLLAPWLRPGDADIVRAVVYRFHATVAAQMCRDSMFLAGDAAHQMPPFLGQGLCSGVRDAANLAWKLAAVAGGAPEELLDTYDTERRPHAAGVVVMAADTGRLVDELAGREPATTDVGGTYTRGASMPSIGEGVMAGSHALVGRPLALDQVDGMPVAECLWGHWTTLAAQREIPDGGWGAAVRSVDGAVLERLGVGRDGAVVVRPDLYVAAATEGVASLPGLLGELGRWLVPADDGAEGDGRDPVGDPPGTGADVSGL